MFGVGFSGDKELDRALETISKLYPRKFLTATLKENAKPMAKAARLLVATDTGDLKRSIRARVSKRLRAMAKVQVGPGKDEFYGMFLEFGTAHHPPKPWMRPAWEQTKETMKDGIADSFAKVLERTAKRINRKLRRGKRLTRMEERLLLG